MAIKRKKEPVNATEEELPELKHDDYDVRVIRAKEFDSGITFDMCANGINIYGCWYRTYEDRNNPGDEKAFIAFPARKGNDGKWYNYAYFKVSEEVLKKIEDQISAILNIK